MDKTPQRIGAILVTLLAAGCMVGPSYEQPRPNVPKAWDAIQGAQAGASVARARNADLARWWRSFDDPVLTALTERALVRNLDLRVAAARVREARALWGVARGGLLPEAAVRGSYSRVRPSENGPFPIGGSYDLFDVGFDASWELDVFGGGRRALEAAGASHGAAIASLYDVQVSLIAEVARTYVDLRGLQARLAIAKSALAAQSDTSALTRAERDAGRAAELDVVRAEAQVSTTTATIPALEAAAQQATHALALLLAEPPNALAHELSAAAPIPAAPREIPVGLPTQILRRRPDVRQAERELAAATARVGVATADLYPRFFLVGSGGVQSVDGSSLFSSDSLTASITPSIRWPLFQGGRIRANIEVQNARQAQAALRFERALLGALRDVEDALVAHAAEQTRRAALAQAVASQERALTLAEDRYRSGLEGFLSVLDAQRSLLAAQDALAQSDRAVAANGIALYKALGGGWNPGEQQLASR